MERRKKPVEMSTGSRKLRRIIMDEDIQQEILYEIRITNDLLRNLIETLEQGVHMKRGNNNDKYAATTPLTQDDYDGLDQEIDLDWWFSSFGEEFHPAKDMNRTGAPYSKQEKDYLFRRLLEISSLKPEVNGGTHTFQSVGKKYSKEEKNTFNCFACIPVK